MDVKHKDRCLEACGKVTAELGVMSMHGCHVSIKGNAMLKSIMLFNFAHFFSAINLHLQKL